VFALLTALAGCSSGANDGEGYAPHGSRKHDDALDAGPSEEGSPSSHPRRLDGGVGALDRESDASAGTHPNTAGSGSAGTSASAAGRGGSSGSGGTDVGPGGSGGSGGSGVPGLRTFTLAVDDIGFDRAGESPMAVDALERVYLTHQGDVYVIDGDQVAAVYLDLNDRPTPPAANADQTFGATELDIGPDGQLYVVAAGAIHRSHQAHQVEVVRTFAPDLPGASFFGVVSPDEFALMFYDGLARVRPDALETVFTKDTLMGPTNCATEDFAIAPNGTFMYLRGCYDSPITRGKLDGSELHVVFDTTDFASQRVTNFDCVTRAPEGGFYVVVSFDPYPHLFHLTEDIDDSMDATEVITNPSLTAAAQAQDDNFLTFHYCAIAVAPSGRIFINSQKRLWRVEL
jgi:hypothetical protein